MTIRRRLRGALRLAAGALALLAALTGCATGGSGEVEVPYADPPGFRDVPPWGLSVPGHAAASPDPRFAAGDTGSSGGVPSPPAVADIHIEQPITLADGSSRTCVMEFSVLPDGQTPNNGEAVRQATVALTSTDWAPLLAAPPNPAAVLAPSGSSDGPSEEQLRANELAGRIPAALFALGLPSGWSLYGQNECH